jgi:PAS domain S-box-containing protein
MAAFSKQDFKAMLDNIADAVFVHNLKGDVLMVNQQTLTMYGITEEQALRFTLEDAYAMPENAMDQLPALWDKVVMGNPQTFEWKTRRLSDDTAFDVEVRLRPVNLEDREDIILATVRDITARKQAEAALVEKSRLLDERVKELNCLYSLSELMETPDVTLREIFTGVVELLPSAWQYPEITCARLALGDQVFQTDNWRVTPWQQTADIQVRDEKVGSLTVGYVEMRPTYDEGPFLKEERHLLNVIAERLGKAMIHVQAENALWENQVRLNEAQRAAHLGYWDWDIRTNDIYWSDEIYRIFGLSPQAFEPTYDAFMERVHPEDRDAVQSAVNATVSESTPYDIDHRIILSNGEVRIVNEQGNVTYNEAGDPIRMIGMVQDITERKRAERALRDSQRMLQAVLDAIPVRVFWKDKSLTYLGCNKLFAEDTGLDTPEEVVGKTDYDMPWTTEEAEMFRADDQRVIESGEKKINYEEPQTRPDGEITWLRTSKAPLRDADDNIIGVLGTYDDITEQKRAQEAHERLLQEQADLQQEIIEAQREALQELSTPVIPVMDRILVMPLVGSIDTMRARDIMRALLEGISEHRAKFVILDVTGVPVMDTGIVNHINKTIQAARLKGARTIVTGISDAVAEAVVDLGIDWGAVETLRDLQTGLRLALQQIGVELVERE